jgi:ABC-type transport system involved in multi-copper enzyme maturation permease subunit
MIILGFILTYILCGLAAVYVAGKVDAEINEVAPYYMFFFLGPFGLAITVIAWLLTVAVRGHSLFSMLDQIYFKAKGE